MKLKMKTILVFCAVLALPHPASARELYVRAGSDGEGTRVRPFADPWQALHVAKPKDVIRVAEGVYNGFQGVGSYKIDAAGLTLLGGYSLDFAQRDPFRRLTVLEQASSYRGRDGGRPIISVGSLGGPRSGVVIDGFVLDGRTKNAYDEAGQIILASAGLFPLIAVYGENIKIRNCIVLNHSFSGIKGEWSGRENEVSNCFIVNTHHMALSAYGQKSGVIRIKNNTVAFTWQYLSSLGAVQIPPRLTALIESNVFMYLQTAAIDNLNPATELKHNVFFQCQEGFYRGRDGYARNALVFRSEDFKTLAAYPELFQLKAAVNNAVTDTLIIPDPEYFRIFSEVFSQDTEKLDEEKLDELRRRMGYSLEAVPPSRELNGLAYKREAVFPALVFKGGQGAQPLPAAYSSGAP